MANEPQDTKHETKDTGVTTTPPAGTASTPPGPMEAAPAAPGTTAVAAGPAPQVILTPDATGITATQPQPAPQPPQEEALFDSWLLTHIHHADVPYLVLVVALAFLLGSFAATNYEIWHHLATGRLLSEGKYTLGTDPFAGPADQQEGGRQNAVWINHSWLFSWISYLLYNYSEGGALLVACKALCGVALAWILLLTRPRNSHGWVGTVCVLLGILALSRQGLVLHPMVISLLFLAVTLLILHRAGVLAQSAEAAQPKLLWGLPPLFVLWINLDSWFIFGPIIVACCLAGLLLEAGQGRMPHFSIGQLSKVLGVSMLASLLNPHHIRAVLLLPVELSYLLVRLGNFWPESMVAGGRAQLELQKIAGRIYPATMSPISSDFWSEPTLGLNVGGISFFLLLGVMLFSFYLCKQASPGMVLVRAVPAALCGVLALLLVRFIPLFGVVGAVIACLNLQEYLAWRETTQPAKIEEQNLWANMTRLVMGFVFFGLLFLSWPGWINHTIGDYASPRRVAWTIEPDPSLLKTAEFLKEKNDRGELKRALNLDQKIASYCAWYAPNMRFLMDHRLQLFDREAMIYVGLQIDIINEVMQNNRNNDWRQHFEKLGLDSIVAPTPLQNLDLRINPFLTLRTNRYLAMFLSATINPDSIWDLQTIYGDGKTMVLAWKNEKALKQPMEGLAQRWRDLAFGARTAPWPGEMSSPEDPGFPGLYAQGLPQPSLAAQEAVLLRTYFLCSGDISSNSWLRKSLPVWELACLGTPNNLSAGPFQLLLTESDLLLPPPSPPFAPGGEPVPQKWSRHVRLVDNGPPEAGLLFLRKARQAVLEDSLDPVGHRIFADAVRFIDAKQEGYWASPEMASKEFRFFSQALNLRSDLRKFQYVAALQRLAKLRPTDPLIHKELYFYFRTYNCLDTALEHLLLWSEYMDSSAGVREKDDVEKMKKMLKNSVDDRLINLDRRMKDTQSAFEKAFDAIRAPFDTTREGKPGPLEESGLTKKAHDLLFDFFVAKKETPFEKGQAQYIPQAFQLLFELDLQTGALLELKSFVDDQALEINPQRHRFRFYYYGVIGDYARADKELADWDKVQLPQEKDLRKAVAFFGMFPRALSFAQPGAPPALMMTFPFVSNPMQGQLQSLDNIHNFQDLQRAERLTMRGILAIEAGNTEAALARFKEALALAGPERWFMDRGIAERYQQLLEGNR